MTRIGEMYRFDYKGDAAELVARRNAPCVVLTVGRRIVHVRFQDGQELDIRPSEVGLRVHPAERARYEK